MIGERGDGTREIYVCTKHEMISTGALRAANNFPLSPIVVRASQPERRDEGEATPRVVKMKIKLTDVLGGLRFKLIAPEPAALFAFAQREREKGRRTKQAFGCDRGRCETLSKKWHGGASLKTCDEITRIIAGETHDRFT